MANAPGSRINSYDLCEGYSIKAWAANWRAIPISWVRLRSSRFWYFLELSRYARQLEGILDFDIKKRAQVYRNSGPDLNKNLSIKALFTAWWVR